jgi:hypothetical protein
MTLTVGVGRASRHPSFEDRSALRGTPAIPRGCEAVADKVADARVGSVQLPTRRSGVMLNRDSQ